MIIINLKPMTPRPGNALPDTSAYYYSDLASWRLTSHPHVWRPPTDVYETEDKYVVIVEIAGMNEEDFSVTLDQNILTISGLRPRHDGTKIFPPDGNLFWRIRDGG